MAWGDAKEEEVIEDEQPKEEEKSPEQILYEKRLKIASEIQSTEETYIQALEIMINNYMHPLLAKTTAEEIPGITKDDIKNIFSNVEHLLPINKSLLDSISKRLEDWHENQLIGDIFLKMAPFFRIYSLYQNNYEKSGVILTRCQANETFATVTDEIVATIEGPVKALESLLIQPIQRIPRYILLLNELERKTPDTHPDKDNLRRASEEFDRVLTYLDKDITSHEFREKFLNMGTKVKGADALIKAHRILIHEGSINIKSKAANQVGAQSGAGIKSKIRGVTKEAKLQIWLFNDVLVHLKNTKNKKKTNVSSTEYTWPLQLVWIKDNPEKDETDPKMPYSFQLVGPRKSYTLHFPEGVDGQQEKNLWVQKITDTVNKVLNEENAPDEVNRCGQYKFPDKQGGEYEGWWRFGKIHGQGTFKIFGNTYTGDWEYNRKSGIGTFVSVTGEVYHGDWKDDKPHGFGQLQYSNNDRYDGEWADGMRSGKGVHTYENGDRYDGEWALNVQNGEGTYVTTSGFIYNGGWLSGRLHGFGCLISPNGRRFEGEFKNGMKHGEGKLDFANGDFYIGQWQMDRMHGYGILHSAVEGVYEGMFVNGYKEGVGKMVYRNGDIYDGSWKRNQYDGKGILYLASGGTEKYEGSFEYGKYHGKGILFYRNGSRYEGQFKEDKPHGNGVYVSANNVLFEGKWADGKREGKSTLCVGPAKFSSNLVNGVMGKGEASFVVVPDVPAIRVEL